jgi:hypothetical protein
MKSDAPDIDPANNGTLAGTLQFCFKKLLQNVDFVLPAEIISSTRNPNRATVKFLIDIVTTQGDRIPRGQLANIPTMTFGGGGFFLSFPLNQGNLGWVLANDRDISLFLQTYKESMPNTFRTHSFSDGVFIPDIMTGFNISDEDINSVVLQNISGTMKISYLSDRIKITAPLVEITGGLQVDGTVSAIGVGSLTITSPVIMNAGVSISGGSPNALTVTGNERVIGNITASGSITPDVP